MSKRFRITAVPAAVLTVLLFLLPVAAWISTPRASAQGATLTGGESPSTFVASPEAGALSAVEVPGSPSPPSNGKLATWFGAATGLLGLLSALGPKSWAPKVAIAGGYVNTLAGLLFGGPLTGLLMLGGTSAAGHLAQHNTNDGS